MTSGNKINFTSLGCPRNLVDSEVMLGLLLQAGYEVTETLEEADYLIVNTCGFLEASREESKETISSLFDVKKESAKVIVAGCMVTKNREEITSQFPDVHYLIGSGDVDAILKAVHASEPGLSIGTQKSYLEQGEVPRRISTGSHFAYLKIAEGCRKGCAYCKIPSIKGPLRSKSSEQILRELRALLQQGIQEVILIAQDLGDYGKDQGVSKGSLVTLLQEMLSVPGEYWLRLLYLYPDEITDELIALLCAEKRLCHYLDMPIQHINDTILKSMRRHTTGADIISTIQKLRREIPDIKIRTSLIVGFPGETEEQFQELKAFVQQHPLDHVGIFKYSREPGTPAASLPNQIPEEVKERRFQELAEIQECVADHLNGAMIGKKLEVIIEGFHPESELLMVGRYYGQCPEIDGVVIINDSRGVTAFGERYIVEITGAAGVDLIGRVVRALPQRKKKSNRLSTS